MKVKNQKIEDACPVTGDAVKDAAEQLMQQLKKQSEVILQLFFLVDSSILRLNIFEFYHLKGQLNNKHNFSTRIFLLAVLRSLWNSILTFGLGMQLAES